LLTSNDVGKKNGVWKKKTPAPLLPLLLQARIQTAEPAAALLLVSESIINGVAEPPSYDACRLSGSGGSGSDDDAADASSSTTAVSSSSSAAAAALFPQPLPGAAPLSASAISKIKGKNER